MCQEQAKRHIHADLIIAWANGAEIQTRSGGDWRDWFNPNASPTWSPNYEYRVKPKPPVKKYQWAYKRKDNGIPKATSLYYKDKSELLEKNFDVVMTQSQFEWIEEIEASCKEFPSNT